MAHCRPEEAAISGGRKIAGKFIYTESVRSEAGSVVSSEVAGCDFTLRHGPRTRRTTKLSHSHCLLGAFEIRA